VTRIGVEFMDIPGLLSQRTPLCFTFFWKTVARRENGDFQLDCLEETPTCCRLS